MTKGLSWTPELHGENEIPNIRTDELFICWADRAKAEAFTILFLYSTMHSLRSSREGTLVIPTFFTLHVKTQLKKNL